MLKIIKQLVPKKTITDQAADFEHQYMAARVIVGEYLTVWFEQIFATDQFAPFFGDEPSIHVVLATQVNNFLFGEDLHNDHSELEAKVKQQIEQVLPHVPKWAGDVMEQDPDLKEFVVQTLRMEAVFDQSKQEGQDYLKSEKGSRVMKLLQSYGGSVPESPSPSSYQKLLNKWLHWSTSQRERRKNEK